MLRSRISRSRGMPCTHDDDVAQHPHGDVGGLGGVGDPLRPAPAARRGHRQQDQVDVVIVDDSGRSIDVAGDAEPRGSSGCASCGSSSTTTTGTSPRCWLDCISRRAAARLGARAHDRDAHAGAGVRRSAGRRTAAAGSGPCPIEEGREHRARDEHRERHRVGVVPHEEGDEDDAAGHAGGEQPTGPRRCWRAARCGRSTPHTEVGDDAAPRRRPGGRPGSCPRTSTVPRSRTGHRGGPCRRRPRRPRR